MKRNRLWKKFRILKSRRGATLVELIITFVLIAMFAVGTFQIVATSLNTYYRIRDVEQSQQVADLILDKVTGLVASARGDTVRRRGEGESFTNSNDAPIVVRNNTEIYLIDRTSSPISISTKDGRLVVHYNAVNDLSAVNWKFDDAVYMDTTIKELKFTDPGNEYPENVIKVDLTLEGRGGAYSRTRYISCYDLPTNQSKISFLTS